MDDDSTANSDENTHVLDVIFLDWVSDCCDLPGLPVDLQVICLHLVSI